MKLLIIGANAAGMSAASRVRRREPDCDVVVLEQTREVSYGACGLPYYVSGHNDEIDRVRVRTAEEFIRSGIDLRLGWRAERIDTREKTVSGVNEQGAFTERYDRLLIASGAAPRMPDVPGARLDGIFVLKTPQDALALRAAIEGGNARVAIVGGGAIGVELAEACVRQKAKELTILEAADQLLPPFDAEFAAAAKEELERNGAVVRLRERITAFLGDGRVCAVETDRGRYDADVVIVSIGVTPSTAFAAGLNRMQNGAILTDAGMRASEPDVFAAGDCASVWHALLDRPVYLPLGTYANKLGRLAGDAVCGKPAGYHRALGTAMVGCIGLELARTGLSRREAECEGLEVKRVLIKASSRPHYYPGAAELTISLLYLSDSLRLVGAQIMGARDAALRIDPLALAIDRGMTTQELGFADFGYAPPFSGVWDAIAVAANAAK